MYAISRSQGLDSSQAHSKIELHLVAAAAGSAWVLAPGQAEAASKCVVVSGNAASVLTAAQATELVRNSAGNVSAEDALIAASLDAAVIPASDIAVILGGLSGLGDIVSVEVETSPAAGGAVTKVCKRGPATKLASSAAVPVASGSVSWYQEAGVLVALLPAASLPAAGAIAKLSLVLKA